MVSVSPIDKSRKKMTRMMSETDLRELSVSKRRPLLPAIAVEEEEEEREEGFDSRLDSLDRVLFLGSGLDEIVVDEECDVVGVTDWKLGGVVVGGGVGYDGGGSLIGGGGGRGGGGGGLGGGDGDESSGYWDSNHGNNITEEYYQKMIDAYPGDALLLSNYAKFLKEMVKINFKHFIGSHTTKIKKAAFLKHLEYFGIHQQFLHQRSTIREEREMYVRHMRERQR
ncbi:hypothetical protein LOK49_LG01G01023 [Camellia lanceoleosa]|uniref:Uncharacterized protein n=1 Tax=Camellia lanceoleosa TaxID=1840588 RepID=A0ACC0IWJ8_9ERIC|nr:hypothetical protein LOK49_LG01G01023 [Camellia lanceoleosa]